MGRTKVAYRVVREVYLVQESSHRPKEFVLFVAIEASKVIWTGRAHNLQAAIRLSSNSLQTKQVQPLLGQKGVMGVVVRFRLEQHRPATGLILGTKNLPLRSLDWTVVVPDMHTDHFGPNAKSLFETLERHGRRP